MMLLVIYQDQIKLKCGLIKQWLMDAILLCILDIEAQHKELNNIAME